MHQVNGGMVNPQPHVAPVPPHPFPCPVLPFPPQPSSHPVTPLAAPNHHLPIGTCFPPSLCPVQEHTIIVIIKCTLNNDLLLSQFFVIFQVSITLRSHLQHIVLCTYMQVSE